jgi:hypothetical protein
LRFIDRFTINEQSGLKNLALYTFGVFTGFAFPQQALKITYFLSATPA